MYFAKVTLSRQPASNLASIEIEEEIADSAHAFGGFLHAKKGKVFIYEFEDRQSAEFFKTDQPDILPGSLTIELSKEAPD